VTKLSIVVPTRNRCDTLIHTLRTILTQDCPSIEIVVSDNFSDDETRNYVASLADPRLKYINTGSRLSMSANWEFALKHCSGEYITFIGDDDGFTPGGVEIALRHLERTRLPAIIWEKAEYCWPDHVEPDYRNICVMRISGFTEEILESSTQLTSVCTFKSSYARLPCVYNGIISKKVFADLLQKSTLGSVFCGICPDVLSSIVVAATIRQFAFIRYPISVNGASRHSNGTSCLRSKPDDKESAHAKFLSELNVSYPSQIQMGPSVNICTMGELLIARKAFGLNNLPEPNYGAYLRAIVKESRASGRHDELIQSAAHTANIVGLAMPSYRLVDAPDSAPVKTGRNRDMVTQRFPGDVVKNIYDACQVVGALSSAAANVNGMLVPRHQSEGKLTGKLRRTYEKAKRHIVQSFPNSRHQQARKAA